jgi:hypothetical protein
MLVTIRIGFECFPRVRFPRLTGNGRANAPLTVGQSYEAGKCYLAAQAMGVSWGDALDGALVEAGQHGGQIFAHRDLQSAAALQGHLKKQNLMYVCRESM